VSNDQDYVERILDAPPKVSIKAIEAARGPGTTGWWIAAAVAVIAVIGAIVLLSAARPSPAALQPSHDPARAEARNDAVAQGAQRAAAHAARSAQAATMSKVLATDAAAQTASAKADATAKDASVSGPAPQP
jgi:hypothetical protein